MFNIRKYLEIKYEAGLTHMPQLLRYYIHSTTEMFSRDKVVERSEILMESLVDELESACHYTELEETTPGLSVKPEDFEFKCLEKPADTKVKAEIILKTDFKFFWKIIFEPPLKKGERVKYAYKQTALNPNPFTFEELMERIKKGTYEYNEPKCEACEWTIGFPTNELQHEFHFPEKYEIENYYPDVTIGIQKNKAKKELQRIKEGKMFSTKKIFDKWVLKLKISKPLLNHTYYTYYVPSKTQKS